MGDTRYAQFVDNGRNRKRVNNLVRNQEHKDIAGFIISVLPWNAYLSDLLPDKQANEGDFTVTISAVLSNTCGQKYSYEINGKSAI